MRGTTDLGSRLDVDVTVHDACHGLRNLGIKGASRALLEAAGARIVEMTEPETCCGFGGVFANEFPEVSVKLADAKLTDAGRTGGRWLASTDLACLMHLEGRRRRTGAGPQPGPHRRTARERVAGVTGHDIVTPGADMRARTAVAVADPTLQHALRNLDQRLHTAAAVEHAHPDWKDRAAAIRRETLADLDGWLDRLETSLTKLGVHVHRAATPADAREIVLDIARRHGATRIAKSKSMATEEIDLAIALEADGRSAVETDLGEYIVQLVHERPSHMITPAIHKTLPQIRDILSAEAGTELPLSPRGAHRLGPCTVCARSSSRPTSGVTGVNFAAADTGTLVLVTNEGNGRFCTTLPDVHVAVMPDREGHARASRPRRAPAAPDVERDGSAALELRADDHRAAPCRRGRRSVGAARRDPRQQPARAARHRVRRHARVHPVRRVPERLPRVPPRRRARVRQRLLRTDGQGAHPAAERRRGGPRPPVRVDAVRRVHRSVPGPDPARRSPRAAARRPPRAGTVPARAGSRPDRASEPRGAQARRRVRVAAGRRAVARGREPDPRCPPRRVRPVVTRVVDAAGLPRDHRARSYAACGSRGGAGGSGGVRSTGPTARDLPVPAAKPFRARWPST